MIKAVIFDFGNVIYSFDNNVFIENISGCTSKPKDRLYELIYLRSGLIERYETGLISSNEFYNAVKELCELSISKADFIKAFTDMFVPIQTTIDLIGKLKPNYKLGLLSNTNEWNFEHIIKPAAVFELFDAVSVSFLVKSMKPDTAIFEDMFVRLKLSPQQCVYVDDTEEFVDVANRLGAHGIHYTCHEELVSSLACLGVRI